MVLFKRAFLHVPASWFVAKAHDRGFSMSCSFAFTDFTRCRPEEESGNDMGINQCLLLLAQCARVGPDVQSAEPNSMLTVSHEKPRSFAVLYRAGQVADPTNRAAR